MCVSVCVSVCVCVCVCECVGVCVSVCVCPALLSMHDSHVSHIHFLLLSLSHTLKFKL